MMLERVDNGAYVVLDYCLMNEDGEEIFATDTDLGTSISIVWGHHMLIAGIERALKGMGAGETSQITLEPDEAFGPRDEGRVMWVDRSEFPADAKVGDDFDAEDDLGSPITLRIVEISIDSVLVDANHPLAGLALTADVIVRSVRAATPEEIAAAQKIRGPRRLAVLDVASEPHQPSESRKND
jgi:FKBP-type peptidyl-prolyl cis-trans isomerase SlyD